jgi:hypothetical protein
MKGANLLIHDRQFLFTYLSSCEDLLLGNASAMMVTIPVDLSTRPCIPLPRFFNSRRGIPILTPFLFLFPEHSAEAAHDVRSKAS